MARRAKGRGFNPDLRTGLTRGNASRYVRLHLFAPQRSSHLANQSVWYGWRRKTMKRLFLIGVIILLLIVGGLVFLYLSLNRVIRSAVETYGPQVTKSEVKLGSVNVSPFSGNASLSNLIVGNPQGFKTPSAFALGVMSVSLDVRSLLSDTFAIRELVISAPEITYELGPGGSNLTALQKNVEAYAGAGAKSG